MLRYIISTKGIQLADHGMSETDLTFIEEMISGTPETERKGRPFSKSYLYGIYIDFMYFRLYNLNFLQI